MGVTAAQKTAIEEIIQIIIHTTPPRGKRKLSALYIDLVERADYPEYYEVIPEPRCISGVKSSVEKGRYKDAMAAYTDLSLIFWNALFYNEADSQIALDAATLKDVLDAEWRKRPVLPSDLRASPPPSSAQKVHAKISGNAPAPEPAASTPARTSTPRTSTPNPTKPGQNIFRASVQPAPLPAPVASTSKAGFLQLRPITPQVSTPQAHPQALPSSDMDVDVEVDVDDSGAAGKRGGSEAINYNTGEMEDGGLGERDGESDEIVRALEKGLPRWKGLEDAGWMDEVGPERHGEIVHAIKSYKDVIGNRIAAALDSVPEDSSTIPNLSYTIPLSLKLIETKARGKKYASSKEFDIDMARLFEKARRWHEPTTEAYGHVLLLQRLYQALTSDRPIKGPPYTTTTNFASLPAAPGTARPVHAPHGGESDVGVAGVTTFRVSNRDRTFVDEVEYKGWSIRLADWVHMANSDDPSRPIVAQVFKCWVSDEPHRKGRPGITVCWYYRPEQTFHPPNRQFWEGEVFKTSHFADHPLEDIIEKIACQFTARHIRGRPRPPFWYPGWPLYVCDSRYNDRDRVFVRIKNWNSCVPEEVRKSEEFMPIYPFERTVFPRRFGSPFIGKGALKGPGGIGDSLVEKTVTDTGDKADVNRKRSRRNAGGENGPSKGLYVGPGAQTGANTPTTQPQSAYPYQYQPQHVAQQVQHHRAAPEDRSIISAAGGMAALGGMGHVEKLPPETAKHFDRDPETNEVLWFSAPPVNVAHPPTPKYSLAYLHFLAMKRKRQNTSADEMDVDELAEKRQRLRAPPTVTETLRAILSDTPTLE